MAGGRHYEDAWQALCYLFGINDALPPRTKRWLEAKVLADCIAIKVRIFSPQRYVLAIDAHMPHSDLSPCFL